MVDRLVGTRPLEYEIKGLETYTTMFYSTFTVYNMNRVFNDNNK